MHHFLDYAFLKTLHIISATLLFGTGMGTFFFMLATYRTQNIEAIKVVTAIVVTADFVFTTPAVVVQMVTGFLLMQTTGIAFTSTWFIAVAILFCLVGALWLPVVWIQLQLKKIVADLPADQQLPVRFTRLTYAWERMGYPAGIAMIVIFILMVYKPFIV